MDPKHLQENIEGVRHLLSQLLEEVTTLQCHHSQMLRVLRKVEARKEYDELSGLLRRGSFFQKWQELLHECQSFDENCGMLLVDIDHFKQVNDTHGHPTGDEVIKRVGELLKNFETPEIFSGRYGGEEFAIAVRGTDAQILEVAERLRRQMEQTHGPVIDRDGKPSAEVQLRCTVSVGMASTRGVGFDADRLLKAADEALYQAKQKGRNQVCATQSNETSPLRSAAQKTRMSSCS